MSAYATSELDSAPARLSPQLLGLVGERFAMTAAAALAPGREGDAPRALAELERLGVQLQQVARMVAHGGQAPDEAVDLAAACAQLATAWRPRADAAGIRLDLDSAGGPVPARTNAAALEQVLGLLVEYALARGEQLRLVAAMLGQPAQPGVRLELVRRLSEEAYTALSAPADVDELLPMLAGLLARSAGLLLHRSVLGHRETLTVAVPLPPLAPLAADDGALLPRTPSAAGGRVLVIDPRPASRLQAHALLRSAGINVDAVESVAQAQAALRDGEPDVLVVGLPARDPALVALVDGIRAGYPYLRVIELVDEENAFAFSPPGADAPGRLSRSELEQHLLAAVAQELYASRDA